MSIETLVIWLIVGLVAGVLAALVVKPGSGYGLIGDIVVGIAGAIVGGYLFRLLHIHLPITGIAASILVAFVGAVLLLLVLRLIRSRRR